LALSAERGYPAFVKNGRWRSASWRPHRTRIPDSPVASSDGGGCCDGGYTALSFSAEPAMRRSNLLLPLCLVAATLVGCGQKGPLTMPPAKPTPASTVSKPAVPASVAPAPAASSTLPDAVQR
jgi:predicted small lipoprotein YifL